MDIKKNKVVQEDGSKIWVLILNWNSQENSLSLYKSLKTMSPEVKVLVLDNNSKTDEIKALKASIPEKDLILNQKNLGYAGGNNVGIKIAIKNGADFIFIVNPDIRLENNTIPMLVEWMESNPRLASVGPRICFRDNPDLIYSDGGIVEPERGYATWHLHFGKKIGEVQSQKYTDVDYVNGSAILLRTEALKHIGPFREDFFLYFEETEWCMRAKRVGWSHAILTSVRAFHQSSLKGSKYAFYMSRNRIWVSKLFGQYQWSTIKNELRSLYIEARITFKKHRRPGKVFFSKLLGIMAGVLIFPRKGLHKISSSNIFF